MRLQIARTVLMSSRWYCQEVPVALRSLKAKSRRPTVQYYVDAVSVRAVAGDGGDGCVSFLSAWGNDHAGPDGGHGGHGGHVIFMASGRARSLNLVRAVAAAPPGQRGGSRDCCGKNAPHHVVPVPIGTIVKDSSGRVVGDLREEGVMFVAARGGAGGRGNRFFVTDTQQAPDIAELGAVGESLPYRLELRAMAHAALLGQPCAGKSTLLRAVTRARPRVAPHPFTTTRPHLGMVQYTDYSQLSLADLPGLIEDSHRNRGLGIQFLQHVERCRCLVFLLDGTCDPLRQHRVLTHELSQYSARLARRPALVAVNKVDLPEGEGGYRELKEVIPEAIAISAKTGYNLDEFLKRLRIVVDAADGEDGDPISDH